MTPRTRERDEAQAQAALLSARLAEVHRISGGVGC